MWSGFEISGQWKVFPLFPLKKKPNALQIEPKAPRGKCVNLSYTRWLFRGFIIFRKEIVIPQKVSRDFIAIFGWHSGIPGPWTCLLDWTGLECLLSSQKRPNLDWCVLDFNNILNWRTESKIVSTFIWVWRPLLWSPNHESVVQSFQNALFVGQGPIVKKYDMVIRIHAPNELWVQMVQKGPQVHMTFFLSWLLGTLK